MFYENFERMCQKQSVSPSAAGLAIGVSKSTPSAWKKNGTIPKEHELEALAQFLHCEVSDFFLSEQQRCHRSEEAAMEDLYSSPEYITVDENVREILRVYARCDIKQRTRLMSIVFEFEETVLGGDVL